MHALHALVDVLPAAACIHRDGRILHANERFATALGSSPGELVDRPLHEVLHEEDRKLLADRTASLSLEHPMAEAVDIRWLGKNGSVSTISTRTAFAMVDGERAVLEVGPDVGEERIVQTKLALSDRLASLGTLAAGVAHEMNNPLTYVLANLEFMREQLRAFRTVLPAGAWEELDEITAEAKSGAERVAQIVRSLKVFSRVDEEKRVAVDVLAVLEVALRMAGNEIRHRAKLVKSYGPLPRVFADEARLTQVFLNLFINAAQAIPDGHADLNEIEVRTATDAEGRATVEVRDTGGGIAPELLTRIFDPFFTTKPQGVGTGLGLSICHGIVTALGGDITATSTVGQGTTFRVVLPGAVGVTEVAKSTERASSGRGRSGRILVIDDDAAIGTAVRRTLGSRHDVVTTTSGRDALELAAKGERFDLILCDLMMPVITGMALFDQLTTMVPDQAQRMVFMTGGAFTQTSRAFLERVPNERIDKPFDALGLRLLVRSLIDARPAVTARR